MSHRIPRAAWALTLFLVGSPVVASGWEDCDGWRGRGGDGHFAETRELTLDRVPARLTVDGGQNGGIRVTAWDRDEVGVEACVTAWSRSEVEARRIVEAVEIELAPTVRAVAPGEDHFSVSYRIQVPRQVDLDLTAHNGGLSVRGVHGVLRLETHNGGLSLDAVAGDVEARTANGGIHVELAGATWDGGGLDVETRNGAVGLSIPDGYSAELEVGTVNGRFEIDFPVTVQGSVGRQVRSTLGSGGPRVRVVTTNGSVHVHRR